MINKFMYEEVEGVRVTSRGICVKDDQVLVIKRINKGEKYIVLPGGGIEKGENPLTAAKRELFEETCIESTPTEIVGYFGPREGHNAQFVVLCDYVSGEPRLDSTAEEYEHSIAGINVYEPVWMDIKEVREKLVPEEFRQYL
jgi:8-oxo-dGTP diphosphatase